MIDPEHLTFKRTIVHYIIPKSEDQEHATAHVETKMINLNDAVSRIIRRRLTKAMGKNSKSFELEIIDYDHDSFFGLCQPLKHAEDNKFIENSGLIAELLAGCQTRNNIPGGYMIFIQAENKNESAVYIVIKAELQEALRYEEDTQSRLLALDDLILSPSTKLYKIGMIYERDEPSKLYPNDKFGCFLFDDQFTPDAKPAEYFYSDFLGYTIESNPKIQSKRFYTHTENFIKKSVDDPDMKGELMHVLKQEFAEQNHFDEIAPMDFANSYFHDPEVKDQYSAEVVPYLPTNIVRDPSLFKSKLEWKKLNFPNKVNISGPDRTFDFSVKVVDSNEELDEMNAEDPGYTILKIKGRPFESDS